MDRTPENTHKNLIRLASIVEIASVVLSVMIALWIIIPLAPGNRWLIALPTLLGLGLVLYSQRIRGESLSTLGLGAKHLGAAFKLVAPPTLIAILVLILVGWSYSSLRVYGNLPLKLVSLPLWALLQQFILQSFIYRRIRSTTRNRSVAMIVTATLFALVHLPNPALTLLTFIGALVWSWVYDRAPNLYPLALSHGLVSLTVMSTLPPSLLRSLSVGYKYFFFQSP